MGDEAREPDTTESGGIRRRDFVAGGLGAVVASALVRLKPAAANDDVDSGGESLLLGEENVAEDTTTLIQSGPGPALQVENLDSGLGIQVLTNKAPALRGRSPGGGLLGVAAPLANMAGITMTAGIHGTGRNLGVLGTILPDAGMISISFARLGLRTGVLGATSDSGLGVWGSAILPDAAGFSLALGAPIGVWGSGGLLPSQTTITVTEGLSGIGVWGSARAAPGTDSRTVKVPSSTGVVGTAFGPDQVAILASNPGGTALQVDGGIAVNCGGTGVIPRRASEHVVTDDAIHTNSQVVVTLIGDPGNKGSTLHHVVVEEGSARIVLTAPPNNDTPFSYLCFDLQP